MSGPRILIAGIGHIFLGDDAFGVEGAQRLARQAWPEGVRVTDFGIRGFDLAYAILDGYDVTIMIDATRRGGAPGTLYVIEADLNDPGSAGVGLETHNINPMRVLDMVRPYGGDPRRVLVFGCEPATVALASSGLVT
jgi:hydrogenase maturation protease